MSQSASFFQELEQLVTSNTHEHSDAASVLQTLGTPALSIAILSKDEIISHSISTPENGTDISTLFQACSISKPICGLAVFRAVQSGRMSLSASITEYLSAAQLENITTPETGRLLNHVTITHLLTHTAGLTVHGLEGYGSADLVPSIETILSGKHGSNSPQVRIDHPPGFRWSYSGGGYIILQWILETVFSMPYPDIMRILVFDPLSMTRSFHVLPPAEENHAIAHSTGYMPAQRPYHHFAEMAPAGLWTTPTDLLKAIRAVRNSLSGTSDFLTPELAKVMLTEVSGANGWTTGGWHGPEDSHTFGHGGDNFPGFKCITFGTVDLKGPTSTGHSKTKSRLGNASQEGIAIMANSALGPIAYTKILYAIAYLRKWPGENVLNLRRQSGFYYAAPFRALDMKVADEWTDWVGKWRYKPSSDGGSKSNKQIFEISHNGKGSPQIRIGGLPPVRLYVAAVPPILNGGDESKSIDLVAGDLEMWFRFRREREESGGLSIDLWPGSTPVALERVT